MVVLTFLSLFLILFNQVYESFSYGENSLYMQFMFVLPLIGAVLYLLSGLGLAWLRNRAAVRLFNSSLAIAISACLVKGIIEISGRSTTIDTPYWWTALAFLILSLMAGHLFPKR